MNLELYQIESRTPKHPTNPYWFQIEQDLNWEYILFKLSLKYDIRKTWATKSIKICFYTKLLLKLNYISYSKLVPRDLRS